MVWILPLSQLSAQSLLTQRVDFEVENTSITDAILELSEVAQISIAFNSHLFLPHQKVTISVKNQPLEYILNYCLKQTDVDFKRKDKRIVLFKKQVKNFTINGYLEDKNSGERLIAAAIWDTHTGIGTTTNEYGFFSLLLPKGEILLQFSYLGYQQQSKALNLYQNNRLEIGLKAAATLAEIIVTTKDTHNSPQNQTLDNSTLISGDDIRQSPALVGEQDLIRYLQTQNGVQSGTDGFGGIYVRGGSADQNLILLDDVPVFNPSHALGFFSVFNTSMIRNAHFAQEGFSAKYGGRLSSVLSVRNKEGNMKNFELAAETSLISTKIIAEIPIVKNKSSLLISARRSHLDPLIKGISRELKQTEQGTSGESTYFFYDLNLKFHTIISKNDRLFLSFYTGKDDFRDLTQVADFLIDPFERDSFHLKQQLRIQWGNTISSLRWNHIFGEKLFSNTTLTYSKYEYFSQFRDQYQETSTEGILYQDNYFTNFRSVIQDAAIKTDFDYYVNNKHKLIFGAGLLFRDFKPGAITDSLNFRENIEIDFITDSLLIIDSLIQDFENLNDSLLFSAAEFNFYIEDQYQFSKKIRLLFGVHGAVFSSSAKTYFSLQPRLSAEWSPNPIFRTYFSVGRMTQFLHVLGSSGAGSPTDLWVPSTAKVKPEQAWQSSLTITAKGEKGYSAKISTYYKKMTDLIRYKDGVNLPGFSEIDPLFWEDFIVSGKGYSYGVETQFQKSQGKTNAGINYTYARSFRVFENINQGKTFPFSYDRPHNLKIFFLQKIGKKTTLNLAWYYNSGRAITLISTDLPITPLGEFDSDFYNKISTVNGHRLPNYHRLDIGIYFNFKRKKTHHFLNIGVYNVYNQANVFYEYWYNDYENPEESSLIQENSLPLLPSISYRILLSGKK